MINSSDELYKIMDKVIEEFNKDIEQNGSNRKQKFKKMKLIRIVSDIMDDFKISKKNNC